MNPDDDKVAEGCHDYDILTGFCMRCGSHEEMIAAEDLICCGGPNVIAISHRRAYQVMKEQVAAISGKK